jgi:hypothetical protein
VAWGASGRRRERAIRQGPELCKLPLTSEESGLECSRPRFQVDAESLLTSDASGCVGKPLGVGRGIEAHVKFQALIL